MTRRFTLLPAILCLLSILGPACGSEDEPPEPTATSAPCPIEYRDTTVRCGYIDVLEDHDDPRGRRIRLPYALVPVCAQRALPDPLVYLDGGPGGSATVAALLTERLLGLMLRLREPPTLRIPVARERAASVREALLQNVLGQRPSPG